MRVVAQISFVDAALSELNKVLNAFLVQPGNTIYGTIPLHSGETDMGFKAPWGEDETQIDIQANSLFVANGDDSFIDIMFGQSGVGAVYGVQSGNGNVEFVLDLGFNEEVIGDTDTPLEAVASIIHATIQSSNLPDEYAAEH